MKKYLGALAGIVVLGGFGYVVYSMRTNEGRMPWEGAVTRMVEEKTITLPKGTPIELLLLEGIDAGGTHEGETVDMGVLKDVVVGGRVVIPMGAKAFGTVTKSRGASLMGAVVNRPARLEMSLDHVVLGDGRKILVELEGEEGVYQFTQSNTADRLDAAKVDTLWNDSGARAALTEIAQGAYERRDLGDQVDQVKILADRLGLEKTKELTTNPGAVAKDVSIEKVLAAIADNDTGGLDGVEAVVLAQAVGEISDLASSVDHKLRGVFKGRTIRATIGTPVMVWTSQDEKFAPKPSLK